MLVSCMGRLPSLCDLCGPLVMLLQEVVATLGVTVAEGVCLASARCAHQRAPHWILQAAGKPQAGEVEGAACWRVGLRPEPVLCPTPDTPSRPEPRPASAGQHRAPCVSSSASGTNWM